MTNFKKGDYVSATTEETRTIIYGFIDKVQTTKSGVKMFKVDNKWFMDGSIEHKKPTSWKPTNGQMTEIKKSFPILKKDNIKVIYECGRDNENGFNGIFGFVWEKGNQNGKMMFRKGEFSQMEDKFARKYGF